MTTELPAETLKMAEIALKGTGVTLEEVVRAVEEDEKSEFVARAVHEFFWTWFDWQLKGRSLGRRRSLDRRAEIDAAVKEAPDDLTAEVFAPRAQDVLIERIRAS